MLYLVIDSRTNSLVGQANSQSEADSSASRNPHFLPVYMGKTSLREIARIRRVLTAEVI